jgi:signal transduction histidine kinase
VAVAAGAGWILVRRLTKPLDRLRGAAIALGEGDFTVTPAFTGLAELDDVGEALHHTARRIGGLIERERTFSADASHQLRTPIAGLRVALEAELTVPRPDRETVLRECLGVTERLQETVDDLLRLARNVPLDRGPLDVSGALKELVQRWRGPLESQGRRIEAVDDPALPEVRASAAAIRHVLDVLVENALTHGRGTVTVASQGLPHGVVITVSDQGRGIADSTVLFRRRAPGAGGIGLALGRTLAAAEGGQLRLRSARPAVFELTLHSGGTNSTSDSPESRGESTHSDEDALTGQGGAASPKR